MYKNQYGDPSKIIEREENNKYGCFNCVFSVKSHKKQAVNGWECLQGVTAGYPFLDKDTCSSWMRKEDK